jgi:alpha-glucosidase
MTPLRSARVEAIDNGQITLSFDGGWRCAIAIVAEGIGRVLFTPPTGLREPMTWAIRPEGATIDEWRGADRTKLFSELIGSVTRDGKSLTIFSQTLRAKVALEPFAIAWEQWDGSAWLTCCADRPSYAYSAGTKSGTVAHWQARDEHDQYFGLGDKTGPLNKVGRRFRTRQLDALGYNGETSDPLYKHWPFFIGRRADTGSAYGVYYDTLAECAFDFGQEYDNYHGFYRATEIADGDLDYYVIAGPDVAAALSRYVKLIGGTAMPPRWSLGYANTAMALADFPDAQLQIRSFLALAERDNFPLSSFHFGSGYTSRGKQRYVFTWNTDKFPDAKSLLQSFKVAGVRTVANLKPCLLNDHPAYESIATKGGFIRDSDSNQPCLDQFWDGWGAHLDFTRSDDRKWWQDNFEKQVLDFGIDVGWNDNNEYEIWGEAGVSHGDGNAIPIHRSRALHALLMTKATAFQQAKTNPRERVYTITRAGPPGIQRYAQTWSGDNSTSWHTMRWNQRMALSMSLSGLFNIGHDIGGFAGPVPDSEMLIRWTQACCLLPRMIMNSWKADGTVNSPWLHADATALIRAAIGLRLHLMPYLYTLMWQASTQRTPVLRPTFFDFSDDAKCWHDNDEMMVGGDLLIAPVFGPNVRTRALYLPRGAHAGGWYDFWSDQYFEGGQTITVDAPLNRLPLFVRAGALLPTTDTSSDAMNTEEASRALRYYPALGAHSAVETQSTLFEDNGLQTSNTPEQTVIHRFHARATNDAIDVTLTQEGSWKLPYQRIRVVLPKSEKRMLRFRSNGVRLDLV